MIKKNWTDYFFNEVAFKLIALLMALVLWILVSGRRDFMASKTMDLEFVLNSQFILSEHNVDQVRIKVMGPRLALRNFMDGSLYNSLNISLKEYKEGKHQLDFKNAQLELPVGVEVIDIRPSYFHFEIKRKETHVQESKSADE